MNSVYDDCPERYDALRQCWLNDRRADYIRSYLAGCGLRRARVLEIGCGTGRLLRGLAPGFPEFEFYGVDPLGNYIEFARQRSTGPNQHYIAASAEEAGALLPEPVDVILSNDVLHHVTSLSSTAASLARAAASTCRWLAIEPNCRNPYTFTRQAMMKDERNFFPGDFRRTAGGAGWTVQQQTYLFLIPSFVKSPPQWAQRLETMLESVPVLGGGVCLEAYLANAR